VEPNSLITPVSCFVLVFVFVGCSSLAAPVTQNRTVPVVSYYNAHGIGFDLVLVLGFWFWA
jgi:hypothetical protein